MSLIAIDLDPIAQHLRNAGTDMQQIGLVRDYDAVTASTLKFPSVFLLPLQETAGPQIYQGCGALVAQRVTFSFGAVLALRDIGARGGAGAVGDVPAHRSQVMQALARYRYPGADDVCLPTGGRILRALGKQGQLLWQDTYAIPFQRHINGGS